MTQTFHSVCAADDSYSAEELRRIAREQAGVVSSIGYGYATRGDVPRTQHGFSFLWIFTQGMGNHGRLVLRGETPSARSDLAWGWISHVAAQLGCDVPSATALTRAAAGVQYGREISVLAGARALAALPPGALDDAPPSGGGLRRWFDRRAEAGGFTAAQYAALHPLSCPRMDSAIQVARRAT